ncbi:hypothetical protein PCC7418_0208 [Halothece sp. PCC 7418]|nr:hypothetical protein PCC7418_0208 [Halothece sp. PCC 7418]
MNSEEAVNLVNIALKQCHRPLLSAIERQILADSWQGITYSGIAQKLNYSPHYIRYLAGKMWKRLSNLFQARMNKETIHHVLYHSQFASYAPFYYYNQLIPLPYYYQPYLYETHLSQAIIDDYYQVIGIFGMIGTGKSTLAQGITQHIGRDFEVVVWHSFQTEKLSFPDWYDQTMLSLTGRSQPSTSLSIKQRINNLINVVKKKRCLLVLDQLEQLFSSRLKTGRYYTKYQPYRDLIQRLVTEKHQSYLIFTSRDHPEDYTRKLKKQSGFYAIQLTGLLGEKSENFLAEFGIKGDPESLQKLWIKYEGNPWALKKAAFEIKKTYSGQLSAFLEDGKFIFGEIIQGFHQEFKRLSNLEKTVLLSLKDECNPFPNQYLYSLNTGLSRDQIDEALQFLAARSLLKISSGFIILSPLFQSYLQTFSTTKIAKIKELTSDQNSSEQAHFSDWKRRVVS